MVVHPSAGHYTGTLVNAVLWHCQGQLSGINGVSRPGIVHRIDKDTTGVLVICKNDAAHNAVAAQLKEHSITTIMQMKYFPAGAKRLRINILRSSFVRSLPDCLMTMSVALSCVQKESFHVQMEPGFTLIWFRKNLRCVTERQTTLAVCA